MTEESDLLREVMRVLATMRDVHPMRRNAGKRRSRSPNGCEPGTPDIEVMLPGGRVVWLELKTAEGNPSDVQTEWHAMARSMGHTVHVVRSVEEAVGAVVDALEAR